MFYESEHSCADTFQIGTGCDFSFPPHLHEAYELITVTEGTMKVVVEEREYTLTAGKAVLVFPDEVHAMESVGHSRHKIFIFSAKFVRAFSTVRQGVVPKRHDFVPSGELLTLLSSLSAEDSPFKAKGALYIAVAEFDDGRCYTERSAEKDGLLLRIFSYVSDNYDGNCTLEALADDMAYSYVYLSRYFKERTGISFTDYVRRYRINEACYRLTNGDDSITDVAFSCGFDSLRSFNRNFKSKTGKTPAEYRKSTLLSQAKL